MRNAIRTIGAAAVAAGALLAPAFAGQLTLTWNAAQDEVTAGYEVEVVAPDGAVQQVLDAGDATRLVVTGLDDDVLYRFRIVPYDQWGNRARRPSRELTTCAQPRIDAIEAEGGVFSRVTLRGANFQPGARILPRRAGLFVDAASVTGTGAIVANLRLAPGVVPEPADFLVVNPVRRAADFLKAHRELADVDGSGLVDEADAAAVALRFGTAAKTRDLQVFDMNGDGMIDGEDAAAVRDHIGK